MRVERIPWEPGDDISLLPRCRGKLTAASRHYRVLSKRPDMNCDFPAHYLIDQAPFCERHAARVVLRAVISNGGTI